MVERTGSPGRRSRSGACSGGLGRKGACRLPVPHTAQRGSASAPPGREFAEDGTGIADAS